jgi:hypothetical protein
MRNRRRNDEVEKREASAPEIERQSSKKSNTKWLVARHINGAPRSDMSVRKTTMVLMPCRRTSRIEFASSLGLASKQSHEDHERSTGGARRTVGGGDFGMRHDLRFCCRLGSIPRSTVAYIGFLDGCLKRKPLPEPMT